LQLPRGQTDACLQVDAAGVIVDSQSTLQRRGGTAPRP
jgi:hypothetical protein